MFRIDANYTDYRDDNVLNMPGGAAVPASTPQNFDGTPWRAKWFNHLHGFFQALYIRAFGSLDTITGQPDNAEESDCLKALERLIDLKFQEQYLIKEITGDKTTIPLSEIPAFVINEEVVFDPNKRFVIFVSPHGDYPEFLNFGASLDENGLHIFSRRLINGQIVPGTRLKTWGESLWGDYGSMLVNIIIKETV